MSRAEEFLMAAAAALESRDLPTAVAEIDRAAAEPSEWPLRGHILHAVAFVHRRAGNLERALEFWRQFLDGAGESGNGVPVRKVYEGWYNYGLTLREAGQEFDAVDAYRQAVTGFREIGHKAYLFASLNNLAWTLALRNHLDEAGAAAKEAADHVTSPADAHDLSLTTALIRYIGGDVTTAYDLARQLADDQAVAPAVRCEAAWILARLALRDGDMRQVLDLVQVMRGHAERSGQRRLIRSVNEFMQGLDQAS